jgi:hypothetical protein
LHICNRQAGGCTSLLPVSRLASRVFQKKSTRLCNMLRILSCTPCEEVFSLESKFKYINLLLVKMLYSVFGIRYSVFSIRYSVFSIQYSVFSIQYSVFSFQYSVFSFQFSVPSNKQQVPSTQQQAPSNKHPAISTQHLTPCTNNIFLLFLQKHSL